MEENVNSANHDDCAIGIASKSECPKTSHYLCGEIHMKLFGDFDFHQQQLIMRRSGMTVDPKDQICSYHEAALLTKYEFIQKQCCNPFAKTKHAVKKDLRVIYTDIADKLQKMTKNDVKPGQKLCAQCRKDFRTKLQDKSSLSESDCEHMDVSEKLNSGLVPLGLSPLKFQRVSQMNSRSYAKRKISDVQSVIATGIAVAGGFQSGEFSQASDNKDCQNCTDYAQLIEELKNKMNISNRAQKIQMLTLAPSSWSIAKTAAEFKVSTRMVKHSRKLKVEVGILALPGKKPGKKISDEIKKKVLNFYEDDEFSRMCPGKKDYISVRIDSEKVQKQKRLLLCNLREMFSAYKARNGSEIGFSKFCELRPKWCVTVGAAGTHSVCVCTIHQNIKLMLAAGVIQDDYKVLMGKTVCALDSKDCMLHRCESCPGKESLEAHLENLLKDIDPEEVIEFKQWIHTDRDTLDSRQLAVEDYVVELVEKIWALTSHHYIAKYQSHHLKEMKENLKDGEVIVLMDFAENYSFIVQDAVQGFHWENSQATLHPFVFYYKSVDGIQSQSICMISDCPRHETVTVYAFLNTLIRYIKGVFLADLKHIHYFSDGSAAQYKNFKNFINLCNHKNDFNISAEWNFFGTSHGKSPCDGIGGTVKRLAARASLQRPIDDQILTPHDRFQFCEKNVSGIKFFYIQNEEIESIRPNLEARFQKGRTVAGTRENHQFVPLDKTKLRVCRVSNDTVSFIADVSFPDKPVSSLQVSDLQPGQYVACIYDNQWWIGNIEKVSIAEHDAQINFMHPHGFSRFFYWPARMDTCWVPEEHILAVLPAPSANATGRQYNYPESVLLPLNEKFHLRMN